MEASEESESSEHSRSSRSLQDSESACREWLTVVLGLANTLLFSGILCGWAALQSFLEDDEIYDHLCRNGDCHERDSRMMFLYGTGQMFSIFAYAFLSFLMDRTGPIFLCFFGGLFEALGLFLLGYLEANHLASEDRELPFDLFDVAIVLTGIGASALMVHALKLAFIVPPEKFALVMTLANCMVDGSSVMPAMLYQLYRIGGSRREIFWSYAVLCLCLNTFLLFSWWGSPRQKLSKKNRAELRSGELSEKESMARDAPRLHGQKVTSQLRSFEFAFAFVLFITQATLVFVVFPQQPERLGVLPIKLRGGLGQPPETLHQVPRGSEGMEPVPKSRFHS